MTNNLSEPQTPEDVMSDVWAGDRGVDADADCSPTKVCRNAREFSFDGIAEGGEDLATSWRKLLEREGKLSASGSASVRDLVLGSSND